jgi:hypothetical protein
MIVSAFGPSPPAEAEISASIAAAAAATSGGGPPEPLEFAGVGVGLRVFGFEFFDFIFQNLDSRFHFRLIVGGSFKPGILCPAVRAPPLFFCDFRFTIRAFHDSLSSKVEFRFK